MNIKYTALLTLALGFLLLNSSPVNAQSATVSGLVTAVSGSAIQVKPASTASAVSLVCSRSTTVTDELGNPLTMTSVVQGQQVMVYYDVQGSSMLASKVIVKKVVGANTQSGATQKKALNMSNQ